MSIQFQSNNLKNLSGTFPKRDIHCKIENKSRSKTTNRKWATVQRKKVKVRGSE